MDPTLQLIRHELRRAHSLKRKRRPKRRYIMVKHPRRSLAVSVAAARKGWRTRRRMAKAKK